MGKLNEYVVNDQVNDYQRLVDFARVFSSDVEQACQQVGIGRGARVADVGCGPIGALEVLSRVVGDDGQVIGIDADRSALERARRILAQHGIGNVTLTQADLRVDDPIEVLSGQLVDLVYSRLVLIHQPDPVAALRQMASFIRPGGYLIVHDWLMDPAYPAFTPPIPAASWYVSVLQRLMRARGASPDVSRQFGAVGRQIGLEEVSQRGFVHMGTQNAPAYLNVVLQTVAAIKKALVANDIVTPDEVDARLGELQEAQEITFREFTGCIWAELVARVPDRTV